MENKIILKFRSVPDEALERMIKEIYESEETGSIPSDSEFRIFVNTVTNLTNRSFSEEILTVMVGILKEYAYRKSGINKK